MTLRSQPADPSVGPTSRRARVLERPLVRLVLGAAWLIGVFVLLRAMSPVLPARTTIAGTLVSMAVTVGARSLAYAGFVRVIEMRPWHRPGSLAGLLQADLPTIG